MTKSAVRTEFGLSSGFTPGFLPSFLHAPGDVAQWLEHLLCTQGVVGSSPIVSTRLTRTFTGSSDFGGPPMERVRSARLERLAEPRFSRHRRGAGCSP
jgi:hypothetical protein